MPPRRGPKMVTLQGPWLGIEERDNYQTAKHCSVALNCDFSDGNIKARKGFDQIFTENNAPGPKYLHLVKKNGQPRYIIGAGPQEDDDFINFSVFNLDGTRIDDEDQTFPEPHDHEWRCSFVDAVIPVRDPNTGLRTIPHRCTLIVTPHNTYIFDVDQNPKVIRKAVDAEAIRYEKASVAYWENLPRGPIAVEHQGRVVYAGFQDGSHVQLLPPPLEENENGPHKAILNFTKRSSYTMGPQWFVLSDPFDPFGIRGDYIFRVGDRERITGLYSFMEQLVVFTDENIYTLMGSGQDDEGKPNFAFRKLHSGVGCISHDSIVEVAGALFFMGRDGLYAFQSMGPEGGLTKISKSIDSIFSGRKYESHIHEEVVGQLAKLGYPFTLNMGDMRFSKGIHIQSRNEVWWTASVSSHDPGDFGVTIVYDYGNQAFSYFVKYNEILDTHAQCALSGVTYARGTEERIVVSDAEGNLYEYGSGDDSGTGIPMYYISGRLFKEQDGVISVRPVRLKLLSTGPISGTNPPRWFIDGEESHRDAEVAGVTTAAADRQQASGDLFPHPDPDSNYFWKETTWAGNKWTAIDWYSEKIEVDTMRSRSFRFGFSDDPLSISRPSYITVQGISIEVHGEDPR